MLLRRLYLLSLISFSSQTRKAVKTSLETVYIFSIYVRISELIPLTRYPVKEKFMSDINKMTKIVKNFPSYVIYDQIRTSVHYTH